MKKILGILMFIGFANVTIATPDDGIREYETVIGYNNESYFCVQVIKYPTGIYYAQKDSAFMIERDFNSGTIKSREFISARHHRDKKASGDWETELYENDSFDFFNFITANSIKYLNPNVYRFAPYEMLRFTMDTAGLNVNVSWKYKKVYDINRFENEAPWLKEFLVKQNERNKKYPNLKKAEYIKVRLTNADERFIFITVSGDYDVEHFEIIFALERDSIESKIMNYKTN